MAAQRNTARLDNRADRGADTRSGYGLTCGKRCRRSLSCTTSWTVGRHPTSDIVRVDGSYEDYVYTR